MTKGNNVKLTVQVSSAAEAKEIFDILGQDAHITLLPAETSYSTFHAELVKICLALTGISPHWKRLIERVKIMCPKEVVNKWVDAFNHADVEALTALYHEDATNHQVTNEPVVGKKAIEEMFKREFAAAEMVTIVENIFEDGQWAILEWRDPLGLCGCGFFHVVNGKILFQRGYWDKLTFLKMHNLPIE